MSDLSLENKTNANLNVPGFSLMLPPQVTETQEWDQEAQDSIVSGGDELQAVIDAGDLTILVPDGNGGTTEVSDVSEYVPGDTPQTSQTSQIALQFYGNKKIPKNGTLFMRTLGTAEYMTVNPLVLSQDYNIVSCSLSVDLEDGNGDYSLALYKEARDTPIFVAELACLEEEQVDIVTSGLQVPIVAGEKYALGMYWSEGKKQNSTFKAQAITIILESV